MTNSGAASVAYTTSKRKPKSSFGRGRTEDYAVCDYTPLSKLDNVHSVKCFFFSFFSTQCLTHTFLLPSRTCFGRCARNFAPPKKLHRVRGPLMCHGDLGSSFFSFHFKKRPLLRTIVHHWWHGNAAGPIDTKLVSFFLISLSWGSEDGLRAHLTESGGKRRCG